MDQMRRSQAQVHGPVKLRDDARCICHNLPVDGESDARSDEKQVMELLG